MRNPTKRRRYDSVNDGDGSVPTTNDGGTRDGSGGGSKNEPRGEGTNTGCRRLYDGNDEDNENDKNLEEYPKASTHEYQKPWNSVAHVT